MAKELEQDEQIDPEAPPAEGDDDTREGADEAPPPPKAKKDSRDEEIERLRQSNRELQESERYWSERARASGPDGDEPGAHEDEIDDDLPIGRAKEPEEDIDPDAFADELLKKGPKAIREALKRDLLSRAEIQEMIDKGVERGVERKARAMTSDATIIRDFPELQDEKSELFEETGKRLRAAIRIDPSAKSSAASLYLAAQGAREHLKAKNGATRRSSDGYDYRDQDEERERERRRRASAQQGEVGRGSRGGADYEEEDNLGPDTRHLMEMWGLRGKDKEVRQALTNSRKKR